MSDGSLTLTIDIGTSSTRVMLWDIAGREIPAVRAQIPYAFTMTADGGVEMPVETLALHVGECLDAALALAKDHAAQIKAVGISCFWHALLGLDKSGKPVTPIYNWADSRAGQAATQLHNRLDVRAVHSRTGCILHPSYYPAKIVWLRQSFPDVYKSVTTWISPGEYLFRQWFGDAASHVSLSMASGTGLLNQKSKQWDAETLQALDLPIETLAEIAAEQESASGLTKEFAQRWPALKDVPFFFPYGDGACGNIGSGCALPDKFAINVGTSGAIRAVWHEAAEDAPQMDTPFGLWRYRVDANRPIMGAAFSDGGNVFAFWNQILKLPPTDELETRLAALGPGFHGLTFLPFLGGERSLGWHPDARAALLGMNLGTDAVAILHAALEAVAFRFALAAQRLKSIFPEAKQVIASGGALAKSAYWAQTFADCLGQPLILAEEPEASSRGAALLAMEAAGIIPDAAQVEARLGSAYEPNIVFTERYAELLAVQQDYYDRLIENRQD